MNELLSKLKIGDNVLIKYDEDWNELATVFNINAERVLFNGLDGKFEFTRKYLLKGDLVLEIIESY